MNKEPDFVGSWSANPALDLIGYGTFLMYISEREIIKGEKESIKGRIEDCFGVAYFQGKLSENDIKFVKRYTSDAIKKGAARDKVCYQAQKIENLYVGEYTVVSRNSAGIPCDWKHPFLMRKYFDPSMN